MVDIGEGSSGPEADVAAIRQALRTAAAAAERGDVERVIDMFLRDEATVLFEFSEAGVITLDAMRANFRAMFDRVEGPFTCRYPRITVRILSDATAYSLAYMHVHGAMADGSALDLHERVTNVWHKVDGRWRAVHEHNSVPVDLATGRFVPKQPI